MKVPRSRVSGLRPRERRGFAVVIAIALMAFLVLLLLALSVLVRAEIVAAENQRKVQLARENARFGALIAVGQLQKYAGPDARVTAKAEIHATNTNHPHWMGVWKADGNGNPQLMNWLVSGNEGTPLPGGTGDANPTRKPDVAIPASANPRRLVDIAADSEASARVEAPLVNVLDANGSPTGGYAWWVSDEGVKAKVGQPIHTDLLTASADSVGGRSRLITPPRFAVGLGDKFSLINGNGFENLPWLSTAAAGNTVRANLSKVNTPRGLSTFGKEHGLSAATWDSQTKRSYHDITLDSYGVLADVRNGRLKRDLTALLHDSDLSNYNDASDVAFRSKMGGNNIDENRYIFKGSFSGVASNATFYGPSWSILRHFYNAYQYANPVSGTAGLPMQYMSAIDGATVSPGSTKMWNNASYSIQSGRAHPVMFPFAWSDGQWDNDHSNYDASKDFHRYRGAGHHRVTSRQNHAYRPILTRAEVAFFLSGTDSGAAFNLRIEQQIILSLYNPYNVPIQSGNYSVEFLFAPIFRFTPNVGSGLTLQNFGKYLQDNGMAQNSKTYLRVLNVPIPAGETKVFAFTNGGIFVKDLGDNAGGDGGYYDAGSVLSGGRYVPVKSGGTDWNAKNDATATTVTVNVSNFEGNNYNQMHISMLAYGSAPYQDPCVDLEVLPIQDRIGTGSAGVNIGPFSFADLKLSRQYLGSMIMKIRTPDDAVDGSYVPTHEALNIRAVRGDSSLANLFWDQSTLYSTVASFGGGAFLPEVQVVGSGATNRSFFGGGHNAASGRTSVMLFDVPRQPMSSLGQLRHANMSELPEDPAYAIGSSLPHIAVPVDVREHAGRNLRDRSSNIWWTGTYVSGINNFIIWCDLANDYRDQNDFTGNIATRKLSKKATYDLSYYLNRELFDTYYFSTFPVSDLNYSRHFVDSSVSDGAALVAYIDQKKPLSNARYKYYNPNPSVVTSTAAYISEARNPESSSGYFMVDGAFNVNSTSVAAWSALLGSFKNASLAKYSGSTTSTTDYAFPRLLVPGGDFGADYDGVASLTANQVKILAQNIVEQVKLRGPFMSMGDFVNRTLVNKIASGTGDTRFGGSLQAALDATLTHSSPLGTGSAFGQLDTAKYYAYSAGAWTGRDRHGNKTAKVSQGDILTPLAPIANVRSDTFKIIAYGQSRNPVSGMSDSESACEMVVQRVPEPVAWNNTNAQLITPPGNLGRRFKVVSFRWLAQSEL